MVMTTVGARLARLLLVLCAMAAGTWACAAPAQANPGDLSYAPSTPVVGEAVTFSDASTGCGSRTYRFTVDGVARPPQVDDKDIVVSFSTPGQHTVSVTSSAVECPNSTDAVTFTVAAALSASITATPATAAIGQPVALRATRAGGFPDYTFAWTADVGGRITGPTDEFRTSAAFDTPGRHVVQVVVTDQAGHQVTARRTIAVTVPTTPTTTVPTTTRPAPTTTTPVPTASTPAATTTTPAATTPAATTPATTPATAPAVTPTTPATAIPACTQRLVFALAEATTTGCFERTGTSPAATWTTQDSVKLNGIPFRGTGQTFTVTFPSKDLPGGRFTAPTSAIQLGDFTAFSGDVDWKLPVGTAKSQLGDVRSFPVLAGTKLFGLYVRGTVGLKLGVDADGAHYASFPLTIELPLSFHAGPDPTTGRATGSASLRVDEAGVHYDGLKLEAKDVWVGKVEASVCLSYLPAGSQGLTACDAPADEGQTPLGCASDVTTNRWDGSAKVQLPGSGKDGATISAFGGLADGDLTKLGGSVSGLGRAVPVAPNVYLDGIGFGLCLRPAPFKLQGTVDLSVFPVKDEALATVKGSFLYTDQVPGSPWSIAIDGSVKVLDLQVGSGSLTYRPWGGIDFKVAAGLDVYGLASINGEIAGWFDPGAQQFTVTGSVRGCVLGTLCATGSGTVSDTGVAGCFTLEDSRTDYGTLSVDLNTGEVKFATSTFRITAGFGYRWGASSPDIFGASCDFTPYQTPRAVPRAVGASVRAAAPSPSGLTQVVAGGTPAIALAIHGSSGPPKVVLRGPGNRTITSPAQARTAQERGRYLLAESPRDGTTRVLLLGPAAGRWTIAAAPGSASVPTSVDRAVFAAPPTLDGRVLGSGAERTVELAYAVPAGTRVRLEERRDGVARTIASDVRGRPCASGPKRRPGTDQPVLCARVRFRPSHGPGGVRRVQAVVSRGAVPLAVQEVAQFRTAPEQLPARPGKLRARRSGSSLVVTLPRSAGASRLSVTAALGDGRKLGFDLPTTCRTLRIPAVPRSALATIGLRGVRYDLAVGPVRSLVVLPNARVKRARPHAGEPRPSTVNCT